MGVKQLVRNDCVRRRAVMRPDTSALAAPLRRGPGPELLMLSCAFAAPAQRAEALERRAGQRLLEASRNISRELLGDTIFSHA